MPARVPRFLIMRMAVTSTHVHVTAKIRATMATVTISHIGSVGSISELVGIFVSVTVTVLMRVGAIKGLPVVERLIGVVNTGGYTDEGTGQGFAAIIIFIGKLMKDKSNVWWVHLLVAIEMTGAPRLDDIKPPSAPTV